jgi:tetratricopeptide (TPR) repeat protein
LSIAAVAVFVIVVAVAALWNRYFRYPSVEKASVEKMAYPDYSSGYGSLAAANMMDVWLGSSKSPQKSLIQAIELLQKAIDRDDNNDEAWSLLCHIYGMFGQFDKALEAGYKSLEINPNSDSAQVWLAMTLTWMEKPEEAIELIKKAIRICPFPPSFYYHNLGNAYLTAGLFEKAISEYKKSLHLTPKNIFAFRGLAI